MLDLKTHVHWPFLPLGNLFIEGACLQPDLMLVGLELREPMWQSLVCDSRAL